MKIEVKKLDSGKKEIKIEVSGDIVKNKFEDVFGRIAKEAKVPGFRQGNAPRDMLEKKYSGHAHELVMKELIPDLYNQAIEKEGIDVLDLPDISDVELDRSTLSFKALVDVRPEIALKNYKGIKVSYKKIEVSPDAVKRSMDSLKESRKAEALDDKFARGIGYPSLAELQQAVEKQIYLQEENMQRQKIEKEIVDNVTAGLDFKLPQSLVKRQLADMIRQAKLDLALKGVPREKIDEQEKALSEQLEPQAKTQVRVYLVLAAIAKKENIAADDHMPHNVMEFLLREADWQVN
ncbi:MAG: trigger factor [Candidatus Omnitrophica bacterium]|nr:trigger factor [Candidatus Omnitrophota bacterium]MDD5552414.1 trigger factor [Candidatus Omnitrophota bacterium]